GPVCVHDVDPDQVAALSAGRHRDPPPVGRVGRTGGGREPEPALVSCGRVEREELRPPLFGFGEEGVYPRNSLYVEQASPVRRPGSERDPSRGDLARAAVQLDDLDVTLA